MGNNGQPVVQHVSIFMPGVISLTCVPLCQQPTPFAHPLRHPVTIIVTFAITPIAPRSCLVCNVRPLSLTANHMAESRKYEFSVTASPQFIADQSNPDSERYVFAYTITIENVGTVAAQLISRHCFITDSNSRGQEVRGLGVVGEQPLLQPGEKFEYTSGCQLETPVGTMRGTYQLVAEDGTAFEAEIPEFTLSIPRVLH